MNVMLWCFAALLLLALHYGFRYGNPMPERIAIEDRLSPRAQQLVVGFSFGAICLATAAVLWLSTQPDNFVSDTPAHLLNHIQTGVINMAEQVKQKI